MMATWKAKVDWNWNQSQKAWNAVSLEHIYSYKTQDTVQCASLVLDAPHAVLLNILTPSFN